jgi:hypothetical protein
MLSRAGLTRAAVLAAIILVVVGQQLSYFPNKKGRACSKFAEECYPCNGQNPPDQINCGCETGQCLCIPAIDKNNPKTFGNFSICRDTSVGRYTAGEKTAFKCALPESTGKTGDHCVADNECDGLQCRLDASGPAQQGICGTVGYPGDKCKTGGHPGQCRGSSPYTYSMCIDGVCTGAGLGQECCLGDESAIITGSTVCGTYTSGTVGSVSLAGKRRMGCAAGLFCNVTATNQVGKCAETRPAEEFKNSPKTVFTNCIHEIIDPQQCAQSRICTNADQLNTPAWAADGQRSFGPQFLNAMLPYPYAPLKNPSAGKCIPAGNLTFGDTCGTTSGVGVLCGPAHHGDTTCDAGVCRFITNSSACSSDANCGYFGICACSNGGDYAKSSPASQCKEILDSSPCLPQFLALRECVETNASKCSTSSYDGTMPWLQSVVMMNSEGRSCFGSCKRKFQDFSCCRSKKDCFVQPPDTPGLITGVIAFVVLVAVAITLLLEIPQNYFPWIWLSLCWWHMWREDIERFILERDAVTQFGTGDRQRRALALFAPKDGTPKCSCDGCCK